MSPRHCAQRNSSNQLVIVQLGKNEQDKVAEKEMQNSKTKREKEEKEKQWLFEQRSCASTAVHAWPKAKSRVNKKSKPK